MPKKVEGILPRAKKRAKMTAAERQQFKRERAEARAKEYPDEQVATNEEVQEMLDGIFGKKEDKKS